jgi:cyclopropane fatty-acyl-phospholipid synthase-like methyltransferase
VPDELHQPQTDDGPDWAAYYRHTVGREPRPLFVKGMAALEAAAIEPGQAVEIGFGDGTETLALLAAGWRVLAVDAAPEASEVLRGRVDGAAAERLEVRTESAATAELPPFDLLYAGYALSFIRPEAFRGFWRRVRARLRPGGHLVVNIFGVRDTWADDPEKTFVARDEVFRMLQGLEVVALDEEDQDGDSFSGPKHWHVFDVIARRPAAAPE